MKTGLLLFAFAFIGFVCEWAFRIVTNGSLSIKEKLEKLKLLLMMFVYGPACLLIVLVYQIPILQKVVALPLLMLFGTIIATSFEFGFGYLFNIVFKLNIWDYSSQKITFWIKIKKITIPLNIMGQIDLFHSFLWFILTPVVINFFEIIKMLAK